MQIIVVGGNSFKSALSVFLYRLGWDCVLGNIQIQSIANIEDLKGVNLRKEEIISEIEKYNRYRFNPVLQRANQRHIRELMFHSVFRARSPRGNIAAIRKQMRTLKPNRQKMGRRNGSRK